MVVWAITEKFADILTRAEFLILMDNNPLVVWLHLETSKLGALEQRWMACLSKFNFRIRFQLGLNNTNADTLS